MPPSSSLRQHALTLALPFCLLALSACTTPPSVVRISSCPPVPAELMVMPEDPELLEPTASAPQP